MSKDALIHAVAVALAVDPDGPLAGILLLGSSGSGKSALALSLIEGCPWRRTALVADDAVLISRAGEGVVARAPQKIAGLIEIRGFGLAPAPYTDSVRLVAGFDLAAAEQRLPEPTRFPFENGLSLPVWPFPGGAGAACRIRLTVRAILAGQGPV